MYTPTNRTFTDVENGIKFRLFVESDKHEFKLFNEAHDGYSQYSYEINGFYICAHTDSTIRLNNGKEISLNTGQFYHLKENERVTQRKFAGMNRFYKL